MLNLPRDKLGFNGEDDMMDSEASESMSIAVNTEEKGIDEKKVYQFRPKAFRTETLWEALMGMGSSELKIFAIPS